MATESNWAENTFAILKSDLNAITQWFTDPGQTAINTTKTGEQTAAKIQKNILLGILQANWPLIGLLLLAGFLYMYFNRRG